MPQRKIRIGLFIDVFFPMVDGVAVVVDNYAKRLAKVAEVIVFAPKSRDKRYVDHFPYQVVRSNIIPIPSSDYDLSVPITDYAFEKAVLESHLDIVHIHSPFSIGLLGIEYAKLHHIPVVATIHSQYQQDFLKQTKSKILADMGTKAVVFALNTCDECWAVNQSIADLFRGFGVRKPLYVHHNATDLLPLPSGQDEDLRQKYQIQKTEHVFLFIGRIDPLKNIYFTVDALKICADHSMKFKMFFVGSGPAAENLKQRILDNHLEEQIKVVGRVNDRVVLSEYYQLADLFLFPSLYDASSLVQIEAASQKTPTVFLRGAATANTVTDRVNGFLVDNDPKAYADCIEEIMNDPLLYQTVSAGAYRDLYHTWDEVVDAAFLRYQELIDAKMIE